jgi:hypothetical protein
MRDRGHLPGRIAEAEHHSRAPASVHDSLKREWLPTRFHHRLLDRVAASSVLGGWRFHWGPSPVRHESALSTASSIVSARPDSHAVVRSVSFFCAWISLTARPAARMASAQR